MKMNRQNHCMFYIRYHIVISTKYRRKLFKGGMTEHLKRYTREIMRHYPDIVIHEINTDLDHVYLLVSIAPKLAISDAVKIIKTNTARNMRRRFSFLSKLYRGNDGIWSIGYFVSTVGINEKVIKRYIEQQGQEDSGQAKLELI